MATKLKVREGSTFRKKLRWEAGPFVYRPIVSISCAAPCMIGCPAHGLLQGQLFCVEAAVGMKEINSVTPDQPETWYRATVVDPDTLQINRLNSTLFTKHTAGTGNIKYRSVVDLTGYKARLTIRLKVGMEPIDILTTENGRITIDPVLQQITFTIEGEESAAYTWKQGVYDLDVITPDGDTYTIANGVLVIEKE
jgi:hypothetical protein